METTRAEQPPRVRRLLPPAWIFRGAGYSASRPAHPQQYTPFTAVARSHSAPHPSHTFKSIRKPFIGPFQGVVLPRRASVFFSGRVGSPRLLASSVRQTPELYRPHRSSGVTRLFFAQCGVVPRDKSLPPCIAFHPWSGCSSSRCLLPFIKIACLTFSRLILEGLKVIAFDKASVKIYLPQETCPRKSPISCSS
jgi:hypothetical protein